MQGKMSLQKTIPDQPKAKKRQQGVTKLSPPRTSAAPISLASEHLAERQGPGFSRLSQAVAQSPHTGCFDKHKAAEIPTLTETTPIPRTQTRFAPVTNLDLALRHHPTSSEVPVAC